MQLVSVPPPFPWLVACRCVCALPVERHVGRSHLLAVVSNADKHSCTSFWVDVCFSFSWVDTWETCQVFVTSAESCSVSEAELPCPAVWGHMCLTRPLVWGPGNGSGYCAVGSERPFETVPLRSAEPQLPSPDGCLRMSCQGRRAVEGVVFTGVDARAGAWIGRQLRGRVVSGWAVGRRNPRTEK